MENKITIPDNWSGVTVEKFTKLSGLTVQDSLIEIVNILTDVPIAEIEKYDELTFSQILNSITWIYKMPDETYYKKAVMVGDKEHFLMNPSGFSIRDWVNYILLIKDVNKNLHKICAILYRDGDNNRGDSEKFKQMMVGDVFGASVFFCNIESQYLKNMQNSLMNQIQTTTKMSRRKKVTQKLTQFFHGTNLFTRSHKDGSLT